MKKLAAAFVALGFLALATPAIACPHGDGDKDNTPKVAEKDKKAPSDTAKKAPAKKAPAKKDESKKKDTVAKK